MKEAHIHSLQPFSRSLGAVGQFICPLFCPQGFEVCHCCPARPDMSPLCRWWSSTPHRSFCPTTAQGSMLCLLLQRTRWLSRADSGHPEVCPQSGAILFLVWTPHPVLLKPCLSQFYLSHNSSGLAVCFTFREKSYFDYCIYSLFM